MDMIIASAIKLPDGRIFVGKRHGDAIRNVISILALPESNTHVIVADDGFITSDLKFLNREEALVYAKKNGQYKREELWFKAYPEEIVYNGYSGSELFSEDLW
jgi:hypothetical protein